MWNNTGIVVLYDKKSCTSVAPEGGSRLRQVVVPGTTEYLVPMGYSVS
jgi:hypothetical protein